MDNLLVYFRCGTPVTIESPLHPPLHPGSFVFDTDTLALYLDLDTHRVQIHDPLKLSLTGGTVTGDIYVESDGSTQSYISADGIIQGKYLEATGNIKLDNYDDEDFIVIDENGRLRSTTKAEVVVALGEEILSQLGSLAFKDSADGEFIPLGEVSAPTVTITTDPVEVVDEVIPGDLPDYTYVAEHERLVFNPGSKVSSSKTSVVKGIASVEVSKPVFTGHTTTVTVR